MKKFVLGVIAVTAAATTFATAQPLAQAATPKETKQAAAAEAWLVKQLKDGLIPSSYGGYNYGPSIDAALSIQAAHGKKADVTKIATAVEANGATSYTDADYCSNADFSYYSAAPCTDKPADAHEYVTVASGGVAKALLLAEVSGVGSKKALTTKLEGLVTADGSIHDSVLVDGVADTSGANDYASNDGEIYAVAALTRAKSSKAKLALKYLLSQQCANGAFPFAYNGCSTDKPSDSVDATAFAVWLLHEAGIDKSGTAKKSLAKAETWLTKRQASNGSFEANANSTGLAGYALGLVGKTKQAEKAAAWVAKLQVSAKAGGKLSDAHGALAYDATALTTAKSSGWSAASDQWLLVAAQALPVLNYLKK